MKRRSIIYFIIFVLLLCLTGCNKKDNNDKEKVKYNISVYDNRDNYIGDYQCEEHSKFDLSVVECPEGYYYTVVDGLEFLEDVSSDLTITVSKTLFEKVVKYIIDGETIYEYNGRYFDNVREPSYDNSKMENDKWNEDLKVNNNTYYYTYTLSYDVKTRYNISFYDGDNLVDVGISSYKLNDTVKLPEYTKDGYVFVGWFYDELSLYRVDYIDTTLELDIKLYARLIPSNNAITLEKSNGTFSSIKKVPNGDVYVYQPVIQSGVKSTAPGDYDWYSGDERILLVSAFSSLSIVSSGYVVLTAKLKTDPTYIINGVLKTSSSDGISISSVEEANNREFVTVTFVDKDDKVIETQKVLKGNFAYLPDAPMVDGYVFSGWDKDNYSINEDTTFKATYSNTLKNKYANHTISLIGDSISTYKPFIPAGYAHFYPYPTADIYDVNMTWWMQSFNKVGAKLFVNDSYSGTCVIGGAEPTTKDSRLAKLLFNGVYADYTLIFMGSNDCSAAKRGSADYSKENFEANYKLMIDKIQALCPNTIIVLCTLPKSSLYLEANQIEYNEVIRKLAKEYKLDLVELSDVDLTDTSNGRLLVDSAHPNKLGMDKVADKVISELFKH